MQPVIGLDFGTTNSAIAIAGAGKEAVLATFADGPNTTTSFRSILYFPHQDRESTVKAETKAGPEAINSYLDAEWPQVGYCVGVFRLEGRGVQLFERIEGDYFAILGMPLLPLLQALRVRGLLAK